MLDTKLPLSWIGSFCVVGYAFWIETCSIDIPMGSEPSFLRLPWCVHEIFWTISTCSMIRKQGALMF
jgi:hypothetical protein